MRTPRFNEARAWGIRLNGPYDIIELQTPENDAYDGFIGATYSTREAAEAAKRDRGIDGEVVPVLLLIIQVSKAEADAEYRYYKTAAECNAGIGRPLQRSLEVRVDSLRKRIVLLQQELEETLVELANPELTKYNWGQIQ